MCDTKDTLCDDHDDTCATVLKTLEMSKTYVYMVISTHFHKDNHLKPPKQAYTHWATVDMWKDDIFLFLKNGPKHLEKKNRMDLNVCDNNIQDML